MASSPEHVCGEPELLDVSLFLQYGVDRGSRVLVLGESPAPNGWRKTGRAFHAPSGRLLPTGVRLNELLATLDLSVSVVGFTEVVKCFIGEDRGRLKTCAKKSWALLVDQIALVDPRLVIVLGKKTHELMSGMEVKLPEFGILGKFENKKFSAHSLSVYHPSPISPKSRPENIRMFEENQNALRWLIDS